MTTEREVRKQLVEALEGLEDGWVRRAPALVLGYPDQMSCTVCDHEAPRRVLIDHQPGCPAPPAYAALEAARALEARS